MRRRSLPTHRALVGTEPMADRAREDLPLGDALLDKRNASYRHRLL